MKEARIAVEESKRKEIQREIEEESRKSAERKKKRTPWGSKSGKIKNALEKQSKEIQSREQQQQQQQQQQQDSAVDDGEKKNESSRSRTPSPTSLSPQETLDQQRAAQAEFNGPCVVCLEPNEESKQKIA